MLRVILQWQIGSQWKISPGVRNLMFSEHWGFILDSKLLSLFSSWQLPSLWWNIPLQKDCLLRASHSGLASVGWLFMALSEAGPGQGQAGQGLWVVVRLCLACFWLSWIASPTLAATPSSLQLPKGLQMDLKASLIYNCKREVSGQWHPHREIFFEHSWCVQRKYHFLRHFACVSHFALLPSFANLAFFFLLYC